MCPGQYSKLIIVYPLKHSCLDSIYVQNLDMEGALDIRDDGTGSTIVIMTGIGDAGQVRSQGWRPEYLGI